MPPRFDLIVFDWDGTLFDSAGAITTALQQAVVDVGGTRPTREQACYVIGLGLHDALAIAAPDVPSARYAELAERYRWHYARHMGDITLFDGIPAMLHALRQRGHRLAIATGKSRRGLNEALHTAKLHPLFDATRTADETASKPHPHMLHELMDALDTPAQRTLMVGDTAHDLQLAHNAGCASVAVSYGAHQPQLLTPYHPLHLAHTVTDLHQWLLAHA